ncbi:MAG: hypothetical protein EBU08_22100 [Micrococcales bacterium]|nr:hypothetical protein [Micrococcales bacterium]
MAAENNLSHEQLAMYMTPKEIKSKYSVYSGEYDDHELGDEEVWNRKRKESKRDGLYESVRKHGVEEPVQLSLGDKTVADGHHRIAAAKPKQLIPVTHLEPEEVWWRNAYS